MPKDYTVTLPDEAAASLEAFCADKFDNPETDVNGNRVQRKLYPEGAASWIGRVVARELGPILQHSGAVGQAHRQKMEQARALQLEAEAMLAPAVGVVEKQK